MMPQFTPMNLFSANWHISAFSSCVTGRPNRPIISVPITTSTEAELERPDLAGRSPMQTTSRPAGIPKPRCAKAQTTALA